MADSDLKKEFMIDKSQFSPKFSGQKYGDQIRSMGQNPHAQRGNRLTPRDVASSVIPIPIEDQKPEKKKKKTKKDAEVPATDTRQTKAEQTKPIETTAAVRAAGGSPVSGLIAELPTGSNAKPAESDKPDGVRNSDAESSKTQTLMSGKGKLVINKRKK